MSRKHRLKILPKFYEAVRGGLKAFEIRKNDRDYQVGDTLVLREYEGGNFTGNLELATVTYITDYAQQDGYVVMGIQLDN